MNIYKTDLVKAVCYEAPSVTVFNVVAEMDFAAVGRYRPMQIRKTRMISNLVECFINSEESL